MHTGNIFMDYRSSNQTIIYVLSVTYVHNYARVHIKTFSDIHTATPFKKSQTCVNDFQLCSF